ncbi:iron ABC transporter permease [uncultured Sphaerochaeta sp.]|uniref:ABC transporter permease n=1 Tax=uncultured Sphaerochaeta sp. TaxID=886478 RepID=UPI002A0A3D52|nr:iron ABC transporter permease [uncultured Sphaerochaeta sp.]
MKKALSLPLLVLLALMVAFPVITIFARSILSDGKLDLARPLGIILKSENIETILNSLKLGLYVVITSTILAYPLAYLLAKTNFGLHSWLSIVLLIPFMTPPYIASMGWILFMQRRGLLEQLIPKASILEPVFFSFGGIVLVMSLHVFPFMLNFIRNAMVRIPSNLEEAGSMLGAGKTYRTRKIVLPLLASGYALGALLVFVKTLSEYGTPATLGLRIGMKFFTTQIHRKATYVPVDFASAASLSSLLVGICLMLWLIQDTVTKRTSYATIGTKGSQIKLRSLGKIGTLVGWMYILLILLVSIGIPYFSILTTSLIKLRGYGLQAGNFTLDHYRELFLDNREAVQALRTSLGLSFASATIASLLGTIIAISTYKEKGIISKGINTLGLFPEMIPNIVLVIGLMIFWNILSRWIPLYNTLGILILAYVIMFLPYTIQYVNGCLTQMNDHLLQAGRVFGASPFYVMKRIVLPLVARGSLTGWIMTFIICFRELVASSLLVPVGRSTVSTYILREFDQGSVSLGMCMAVICVLCTTSILLILERITRKGQQK